MLVAARCRCPNLRLRASSRDDPAIQPNILISSPRNSSTDHEECSSNDISQLYELVEASVVAIPVVSVINNDVERDQPERTGGIPNASPVNTGYSRESFLLSLLDLDSFVHRPVPQLHGRVRCYILRKRIGDNWHHPVYSLYVEVCIIALPIVVIGNSLLLRRITSSSCPGRRAVAQVSSHYYLITNVNVFVGRFV
jgi:hypothetical protein